MIYQYVICFGLGIMSCVLLLFLFRKLEKNEKNNEIIAMICAILLAIVITVAYFTGHIKTTSDNELIFIPEEE